MIVVDSDGHVHESEAMFNLLDKKYYPRRPVALSFATDTVYGLRNAVWFIDGETYPKLAGKGGVIFQTPTVMELAKRDTASVEAQEMTNVGARLKDLDQFGIDVQVVYPTLFLTTTTEDVKLEAALLQSYNSFMAEACSKSGGRIRFAALVPIRDIEESKRELRRAKGLGAASVMLHGMAWDKVLGDTELHSFYEEAAKLEIPVCVHFGWGSPTIRDCFRPFQSFFSATMPVIMGFHSIMLSGVLDTFPGLRFAFLETGSLWVPYVIQQLKRGRKMPGSKDPAQYFRDGRVYIACEADEDINYLVQWIGSDCMVAASDYPHTDLSQERQLSQAWMAREDIPLDVKEKILSGNPRRLYGV